MTIRFVLLNLLWLGFAQWLFFKVAEPSASPAWIEFLPVALNVVFFGATGIYFLFAALWLPWFRRPILRPIGLGIAAIAFFILWSRGIVLATNLAQPPGPNGALFYATSGLDFLEYNRSVIYFCLVMFLPPFGLNLLTHALLWDWLFPFKRGDRVS